MYADVAAEFAHFSDPAVLSRESDENKIALFEQAARVRERREASLARAVFLAVRAANGINPVTKQGITLKELASNYPEME